MPSNTLSHIWGCDVPPETHAPLPSVRDTLLNDILVLRWGAHQLAHVFSIIPSSEPRFRNEAIAPLYEWSRTSTDQLKRILTEKGITVPTFPDIPVDMNKEAEIDYKTIEEALFPHMAKELRDSIEYAMLVTNNKKYHWTTVVTPMVVMSELMVDIVAKSQLQVGTKTHRPPTTFLEMVTGDESLQPYLKGMISSDHAERINVASEELLKIRSRARETGWREEEAKDVCLQYISKIRKFFVI